MLKRFIQIISILSGVAIMAASTPVMVELYKACCGPLTLSDIEFGKDFLPAGLYGLNILLLLLFGSYVTYKGYKCWGYEEPMSPELQNTTDHNVLKVKAKISTFSWAIAAAVIVYTVLSSPLYRSEPLHQKVSNTLRDYSSATLRINDAHRDAQRAKDGDAFWLKEQAESAEKLPLYQTFLKVQSTKVDEILKKASDTYGEFFSKDSEALLAWKKEHESLFLSTKTQDANMLRSLRRELDKNIEVLKDDMRAATGIYHINNVESAEVMVRVEQAIDALAKSPNDPKLCTIMLKYKPFGDRKPTGTAQAQQIAFMRAGEQYCPDYYHTRKAWPTSLQENPKGSDKKTPYDALPYNIYYDKHIHPLLSKYENELKNKKFPNSHLCLALPFTSGGERNPERDAMTETAKMFSKQYCTQSPAADRNLSETGLECIERSVYMYGKDSLWDVLERCRESTGPLFKQQAE